MKKVGYIFGERIKGDLDLGFDPVNNRIARILGPGRRTGVVQSIYDESATPNYDVGSRQVVDDRVYHYGLAGGALVRWKGGANWNQWPSNAASLTAAASGSSLVTVVDAISAVNAYAGGYVTIFTSPLQMRRVVSSTVSDGTEVVLTVDGALETTAPIGTWITAYPSIYSNVRQSGGSAYVSFVCVPNRTVTSGYYFWGQTYGPCYGVVESIVPGSGVNSRFVNFSVNGHLHSGANLALGYQPAGFLLPRTGSGTGDQLYMLQLAG